jgi:hypothetical protein
MRARVDTTRQGRRTPRVSEVQEPVLEQAAKDRQEKGREQAMTDNTMVCPFLDSNPRFAYGVEFGMLYVRMRDGNESEISGYFCRANQDQILLAASRMGWHVTEMKPWGRDWLWLNLEKPTDPIN